MHYLISRLPIKLSNQDSKGLALKERNASMEQNGEFRNRPHKQVQPIFYKGEKQFCGEMTV